MAHRTTRIALLAGTLLAGGCVNIFAAYEDPPPGTGRHDPHKPRALAFTLLRGASTVAYSDDGQHFGVHLCKAWRDDSVTCELGFGTREGLNELWPVLVPARSLDSVGARAVVDVLARRLRKFRVHLMEDHRGGRIVTVAGEGGEHRVTLDGDIIRLAYVTAQDSSVERPLAAVEIEGGPVPTRIEAYASYRRRDAVAVEIWHDAGDGAVARYNDWVLFFRDRDGHWRSSFVRGLDDDGPRIYAAPANARPAPAVVEMPAAVSGPPAGMIAE